ncbi:hypothetical protein [Xenorhabdus ehlersii]|uniref:hypothetical protein n=1 Tax=Xenorhabdus ehlersii TaxID=290111 RepID=UPI001FC92ECB|nr:hypothetical protein [Xenorhabdus ehlersii]
MLEILWSKWPPAYGAAPAPAGRYRCRTRGVVVNQGKGHKDRVVPIGERALSWLDTLSGTGPATVSPTS